MKRRMKTIGTLRRTRAVKVVLSGNVGDVEIMISGAGSAVPYYDIILRTGAWGKDIIVPTAIAAAATAGNHVEPCYNDVLNDRLHTTEVVRARK